MRRVRMTFHQGVDGWWARSPDMPGYTAIGDSVEELRELLQEGVPFYFDDDGVPFEIVEQHETATAV